MSPSARLPLLYKHTAAWSSRMTPGRAAVMFHTVKSNGCNETIFQSTCKRRETLFYPKKPSRHTANFKRRRASGGESRGPRRRLSSLIWLNEAAAYDESYKKKPLRLPGWIRDRSCRYQGQGGKKGGKKGDAHFENISKSPKRGVSASIGGDHLRFCHSAGWF